MKKTVLNIALILSIAGSLSSCFASRGHRPPPPPGHHYDQHNGHHYDGYHH